MPYDEHLADRVRDAIPGGTDVTERKMFGGLAFLLSGHMFAGIVGSELMVRLGHDAAQQALQRDHVREMDFTGRPMKNMIFVQPAGLHGPALEHWITQATDHARACRASTEYARPATDEAAGTGRYPRGEPGGQLRCWPQQVGDLAHAGCQDADVRHVLSSTAVDA